MTLGAILHTKLGSYEAVGCAVCACAITRSPKRMRIHAAITRVGGALVGSSYLQEACMHIGTVVSVDLYVYDLSRGDDVSTCLEKTTQKWMSFGHRCHLR